MKVSDLAQKSPMKLRELYALCSVLDYHNCVADYTDLSSEGTQDPSRVIAQTPLPQPGSGQVEPPGRNPSGVLHPVNYNVLITVG